MGIHNVMYEIDEANAATSSGRAFKTANGYILGWGTTVGNGDENWAPGALFIDTNAAEGSQVFRNVGTKTTANFDSLGESAAEISIADSGSLITATEVEAALQEIFKHVQTAEAILQLPLGSWTEQDGTALADFADGASTTPGWSAGDETHGIRWNNHANPDPISTSVPIPPDLDGSKAVRVKILAAKTGATIGDAVTFLIEVFNNTVGALYDADIDFGGTSSAMVGNATAKTVAELTLSLSSAQTVGAPGVMVITLQPTDGTLGTDDVIVLGVWLEYSRKVMTT